MGSKPSATAAAASVTWPIKATTPERKWEKPQARLQGFSAAIPPQILKLLSVSERVVDAQGNVSWKLTELKFTASAEVAQLVDQAVKPWLARDQ